VVYVLSLLLLGMMTDGATSVQAVSANGDADSVGPVQTATDPHSEVVRLLRSGSATSDDVFVSLRHVRLEASPPIDEVPSATLKFDVHNEGTMDLADVELSISLLGPPIKGTTALRELLVRPFSIRLNTVVLAGYILKYEIRLRNLSAECDCVPKFQLVKARAVANDGR
jgi:hypothetical protein